MNGGSIVQTFMPNLEFVRDMAKQLVASPHFAENPQALPEFGRNETEYWVLPMYCGVQKTMFHQNGSCKCVYNELTLTKEPA